MTAQTNEENEQCRAGRFPTTRFHEGRGGSLKRSLPLTFEAGASSRASSRFDGALPGRGFDGAGTLPLTRPPR